MTNYKYKYLKYKKKYLELKGGNGFIFNIEQKIKDAINKLKSFNIKIVDIETIKENDNIYLKINLGKESDLNDNGKLITKQIEAVCKHYGIGYKITTL